MNEEAVTVFRPESDPRESSKVRPWMTEEERQWLYEALAEEAKVAYKIHSPLV